MHPPSGQKALEGLVRIMDPLLAISSDVYLRQTIMYSSMMKMERQRQLNRAIRPLE